MKRRRWSFASVLALHI